MTLKSDAKFEEKLICCLKNDKNLVHFDQITQNSQNYRFGWFLLGKVCKVSPKKVQRSYVSWHWRVMENLKKNCLAVWRMAWWIRQVFTRVPETLKIGTLMGYFYPKYKMYELKIYRLQRSYVLWKRRMMQNLKRNWLVVSKL